MSALKEARVCGFIVSANIIIITALIQTSIYYCAIGVADESLYEE